MRRQAVSMYAQLLRDGMAKDVGVETVWSGKDKELVEMLDKKEMKAKAADKERQALCEAVFGCVCPHTDRFACLTAIQAQLYEKDADSGKAKDTESLLAASHMAM